MHFDSQISPKRAKYIIENKLPMGDLKYSYKNEAQRIRGETHTDGITPREFEELQYFMKNYPHNTCIYDILVDISLGIYKVLNKIHSHLNERVTVRKGRTAIPEGATRSGVVREEIMNKYPQYRDSRGFKVVFDQMEQEEPDSLVLSIADIDFAE